MSNPRTIAKIAARIKERAAHCIEFELSDPRSAFITLTRVEVTPDLSQARVFYSVLGPESDRARTQRMLEDAAGFVQRKVARVLRIRRVPRLVWHYDDSIEVAAKLNSAIVDAIERDRAINPEAHEEIELEEPEQDERQLLAREYDELLEEQGLDEGEKPPA